MRRTRVRVSVFRNSVIHKILSEFLQPFRYVGNLTGLPVLARDPHFYLVLGFRLVHSATLLMFQKNTGLTVLVFPHFHLTRLLDGDLNGQFPDLKES